MNKIKKKLWSWLLVGILLAGIAAGSTGAEAKSGTWKKDKKGWWYSYSDGTYAKNQWVQSGGKWYYFASNGYLETEGYRQGYWLGKDGAASTKNVGGTWKKSGKKWWFTDKTGWYPKKQWLMINGKYYYFGADGYLVTNRWIGPECVNANGQWVPNASAAWVDCFISEVKSFNQDAASYAPYGPNYALIYADDDSTPELVMQKGKRGAVMIYTYKNGKAYGEEYQGKQVTWVSYDAIMRELISHVKAANVDKWKGTYVYGSTESIRVKKVLDDGIEVVAKGLDASGESTFETKKTLYFENTSKKVVYEYLNGGTSKILYTLKSDRIRVDYPEGWYADRDYIKQ